MDRLEREKICIMVMVIMSMMMMMIIMIMNVYTYCFVIKLIVLYNGSNEALTRIHHTTRGEHRIDQPLAHVMHILLLFSKHLYSLYGHHTKIIWKNYTKLGSVCTKWTIICVFFSLANGEARISPTASHRTNCVRYATSCHSIFILTRRKKNTVK